MKMGAEKILLAHGSGGKLSHELIKGLFLSAFENPVLGELDDSARLDQDKGRLAFSTDSYTVKPLFFPGGDIGKLAIYGTVNDLAMVGASPRYISISFIIEEGFFLDTLRDIVDSITKAAKHTGVEIVTGDTKVVEKGEADGLFINTAGIGYIRGGADISGRNGKVGDSVLLSGTIGDHGTAVLSQREGFQFQMALRSDCAPLHGLVEEMLDASTRIHVLRDPTRGGLATVLWEVANASRVGIVVEEEKIKVREEVRGVCDLLGFDPYYLANEGKLVAFVPQGEAEKVLEAMRGNPLGSEAAIIGRVVEENPGRVLLKTRIGGHRLLEPLSGELLPRIC
jgi:hydrogenase expression/formation protein HypE